MIRTKQQAGEVQRVVEAQSGQPPATRTPTIDDLPEARVLAAELFDIPDPERRKLRENLFHKLKELTISVKDGDNPPAPLRTGRLLEEYNAHHPKAEAAVEALMLTFFSALSDQVEREAGRDATRNSYTDRLRDFAFDRLQEWYRSQEDEKEAQPDPRTEKEYVVHTTQEVDALLRAASAGPTGNGWSNDLQAGMRIHQATEHPTHRISVELTAEERALGLGMGALERL